MNLNTVVISRQCGLRHGIPVCYQNAVRPDFEGMSITVSQDLIREGCSHRVWHRFIYVNLRETAE